MIIDPAVIRQVSREKDIDAEKMFGALEEAMSSAARKYYRDKAMVTLIDRKSGEMTVYSPRTVVAELDTESEEPPPQVLLEEARELLEKHGTRGELRILRPGAEGEATAGSLGRAAGGRGPHLPGSRGPGPHRGADGQAGALPEGAGSRARQHLQRVLPQSRGADERHGETLRARRHDRGPREDRSDHSAGPAVARRALRAGGADPRPSSTTSTRTPRALSWSSRGPIRACSSGSSRWRSPRSTTAPS